MKTLLVECGGGLCNRLNNIINGFYFYEKFNFDKLYFAWRNQTSFSCKFEECFIREGFEVLDEFDADSAEKEKDLNATTIEIDKPHRVQLLENDGNFRITASYLSPQIESNKLLEIIHHKTPKPIPSLYKRIKQFVKENDLKEDNFVGVHIRRTDQCNPTPNDQYYINEITEILNQDEYKRFFLCSDDSTVEEKIVSLFGSNIVVRPKKHQPVPIIGEFVDNKIKYDLKVDGRLKDLGWNVNEDSPTWWERERNLNDPNWTLYNVYRGPETVQEGIIDLFLLSKAEAVLNSSGTFNQFAKLMVQCKRK